MRNEEAKAYVLLSLLKRDNTLKCKRHPEQDVIQEEDGREWCPACDRASREDE